jgi:hypothetical protein
LVSATSVWQTGQFCRHAYRDSCVSSSHGITLRALCAAGAPHAHTQVPSASHKSHRSRLVVSDARLLEYLW